MYPFAARAQLPTSAFGARAVCSDTPCLVRGAAPHLRFRAGDLMLNAVEPAIAVDQLVKVYKTTRAVDGISFALERGSITGLLGGNGAGKTTTIAMITGLVMPTSGTVKVLGAAMRPPRSSTAYSRPNTFRFCRTVSRCGMSTCGLSKFISCTT